MMDVMDCENQRKSRFIPALFVWKVLRKQGIYSVSGRGIWCAVRVMADTVGLDFCFGLNNALCGQRLSQSALIFAI